MPQGLGLNWYRLVFLVELLLAELMFTFRLKKRKHFWYLLPCCLIVTILITYFYPLITPYTWWYTSIMFLVIFMLSLISLLLLFDEKPVTIIFLAVASYMIQHIAYQANNSIMYFCNLLDPASEGVYGETIPNSIEFSYASFFIYLISHLIIYILCFIFFANKIKKDMTATISNNALVFFIAFIFVIIVGMNAFVVYNLNKDFSSLSMGFYSCTVMICCLFALSFMFRLLNQKNLEKEIDDTNHLLRQEKRQYELSKNNVELINKRVHDLKHQMTALMSNENLKKEVVNEMASAIEIYDSSIKTGNKVLDTILTEKSLSCSQSKIKLSCLVDGEDLNFISEIDLFTFFGNALDNSIESVIQLPIEERVITLTSKKKGNAISLVIRNYTKNKSEDIKLNESTLKSTKDEPFHGYGMKSMESICEKYNGNMSFNLEGNIFTVYALFINN